MFEFYCIVIGLASSFLFALIEIPKMLKLKLYREFGVFLVILLTGTFIMIMNKLDIRIPNPSDFIAWLYSPLKGFMKEFYR